MLMNGTSKLIIRKGLDTDSDSAALVLSQDCFLVGFLQFRFRPGAHLSLATVCPKNSSPIRSPT